LRDYVALKLPEHMVPSAFMVLDSLPLTANGKVDRRALPAPEAGESQGSGYVAPRTEVEHQLCEIWQELLGVERVGIEESFFDLGGHSLLVIKLVSRINARFGIRLSPRRIFESSSVLRLAAIIDGFEAEAPAEWDPLSVLSKVAGAPQLYCIPGAGMSSVTMEPLARALTGRVALTVLETRGLDGLAPPQTSLEEVVESFALAIKRRQAQGPYHLLGHSFGGCIAFELARWFERRNDSVSLVMLDSFLDSISAGDAKTTPAPADLPGIGDDQDNTIETALPGFREVLMTQLEMQRRYRPSGKVNAPMTLLYAAEGAMAGDRLQQVLARYDRVAEQPVRHRAVRGGHHSMLSEKNAAQLAERLWELIGQPSAIEVS
jgi:thioesterase domain-containing protein/acyl carrier protein